MLARPKARQGSTHTATRTASPSSPAAVAAAAHGTKQQTHSPLSTALKMRILVGVKRVIDYAVKVRVAADKKGTLLV